MLLILHYKYNLSRTQSSRTEHSTACSIFCHGSISLELPKGPSTSRVFKETQMSTIDNYFRGYSIPYSILRAVFLRFSSYIMVALSTLSSQNIFLGRILQPFAANISLYKYYISISNTNQYQRFTVGDQIRRYVCTR